MPQGAEQSETQMNNHDDDYSIFGPFIEFDAAQHIRILRKVEHRRAWDANARVARSSDLPAGQVTKHALPEETETRRAA